VKFLEGEGAGATVGGEIGRERGDALEEVLGSGVIADNGHAASARLFGADQSADRSRQNPQALIFPSALCRVGQC
jgi:hypothetical protein